jgi:hypothetical protein
MNKIENNFWVIPMAKDKILNYENQDEDYPDEDDDGDEDSDEIEPEDFALGFAS